MLGQRLRYFMRKRTNPIEEEFARKWSQRLNAFYLFFAWNAACLTMYFFLKKDEKLQQGEDFAYHVARHSRGEQISIIRSSGLSFEVENVKKSKLEADYQHRIASRNDTTEDNEELQC